MDKADQKISLLSDYVFLKKYKDKWGIIFSLLNQEFLVSSVDLGESLYAYEEGELVFVSLPDFSERRVIKVINYFNTIEWVCPAFKNGPLYFERKHTVNYVISLLKSFISKREKGDPNSYKEFERIDVLQLLIKQLQVLPTPFLCKTDQKDLLLEKIYLLPVQDNSNECYKIKIGGREVIFYDEFYGGGEIDKTRLQLESFISNESCKIIFAEECEENELIITSPDSVINEKDQGIIDTFLGDNIVKVKFIPFYSKYSPILMGFGKKMTTIKNIYEGLLLRTLDFPFNFDPDFYERPTRKDGYNMAKSYIIEHYIKGFICNMETSKENAKKEIDRVIWIDPDYDVCFWEMLSEEAPFGVTDDTIYDTSISKDGKPIKIEGLSKWAKEMQEIIIKSETGEVYEKDWEEYHTRGLQLAHELREGMADNIDLWYEAPYEDKSGIIPHPILILKEFIEEIENL